MSEHFEAIIGRDKLPLSPSCGSLIELKDGRLMLAVAQGMTEPKPTNPNSVLGSNKVHVVSVEWLYA